MPKAKPKLTIEEHLKIAEELQEMASKLRALQIVCGNSFGVSHQVTKRASRSLTACNDLRFSLDNEYHKVATDEDFMKHGHVYY